MAASNISSSNIHNVDPKLSKVSILQRLTLIPRSFFLLLICIILSVAIIFDLSNHFYRIYPRSKIECIYAMGYQTPEGIGQTMRRNQHAFFIADMLNVKLSFPKHVSEHGYDYQQVFDQCEAPTDSCILNSTQVYLETCPRGDCRCLGKQFKSYIKPLSTKCTTIGVPHFDHKTMEYSGCLKNVLTRYLGGKNRWKSDYDAIHYRQGDIANKAGQYRLSNLYIFLNFMCKYSNRDIVVVTEGDHEIPTCGNRVVLAGNSSIQESFRIFQHAKWVGVGYSGFCIGMTQMATPERIVMQKHDFHLYDWVDTQQWTVFNEYGIPFNFGSKKSLLKTFHTSTDLDKRSFGRKYWRGKLKFESAVPKRRWEDEVLSL